MKALTYAFVLMTGTGMAAIAQQPTGTMSMHASPDAGGSPSSKGFKAANEKMMQAMTAPMTGDTDRDFVAEMIPHHAGAIDMAKVELQYGKDPVMRQLADTIISAQENEIAQMKAWQAKHK